MIPQAALGDVARRCGQAKKRASQTRSVPMRTMFSCAGLLVGCHEQNHRPGCQKPALTQSSSCVTLESHRCLRLLTIIEYHMGTGDSPLIPARL